MSTLQSSSTGSLRACAVFLLSMLAFASSFADRSAPASDMKTFKAGIIGCDTSHVPAFTAEFNNPDAQGDLAAVKVVAAFPGGSPDIPASRDRVEGFTNTLRDQGVEIVDSIPALLEKVDVVLIE